MGDFSQSEASFKNFVYFELLDRIYRMANSSICKVVGVASLSLAGFLSRDRHHVSNCDELKPNWDSFDDEPKSKGTNHFVLVRNAQTHKFPGVPLNSTPQMGAPTTDCLTDLGRE